MTEQRATRRQMLKAAGRILIGGSALSVLAGPIALAADTPRRLSFVHLHTAERLNVTYWRGGRFDAGALADVNQVLRDWRTGQVTAIDPALLDLLYALHLRLESTEPYQVICGYRCADTNRMLAGRSTGVARNSLHTLGKAIDVALPDRSLTRLRDTAMALAGGGVGFYPKSGFVHVDTGRVRHWG